MLFATVAALTPLCSDVNADACAIDASKYLGSWYEIGRTEIIRNTFEKDSTCVVAQYALKPDGDINVFNTQVNSNGNQYQTITGSAKILAPGQLKVAFGDNTTGGKIGAFFQSLIPGANYNVKNVWVDEAGNYKRALVTYGKSLPAAFQFTWILSRDESISDAEITEYLKYAQKAGFNTEGAKFQRTPCTDAQRAVRLANLGF
ncbi:Calycin-like protein [Gorgonomyces haynaldii]|nr:Calycin-like protein [Gorgonomyces haynaldii]